MNMEPIRTEYRGNKVYVIFQDEERQSALYLYNGYYEISLSTTRGIDETVASMLHEYGHLMSDMEKPMEQVEAEGRLRRGSHVYCIQDECDAWINGILFFKEQHLTIPPDLMEDMVESLNSYMYPLTEEDAVFFEAGKAIVVETLYKVKQLMEET